MTNPPENLNHQSQAIGISRFIAAFLIVSFHAIAYIPERQSISGLIFLLPPLPFFFFFAGYFSKQVKLLAVAKRVFLLACMLAFWELVCLLLVHPETLSAFLPLHLLTRIKTNLLNYPLWFLRYLLVFTLFIPILARLRKYTLGLAILLFVTSEFNMFAEFLTRDITRWFNTIELSYFVLGFSLQWIKLQNIEQFFKRWDLQILFLYISFCVLIQILKPTAKVEYMFVPFASLTGILFLCSMGTLIQQRIPRIASFLYNLSECSFLIFVCHVPLMLISEKIFNYHPLGNVSIWITASVWPILTILFAKLTILVLRKLTPSLLPFITGLKK